MSLRDFEYISPEFALEDSDMQILKIDWNSRTKCCAFDAGKAAIKRCFVK